MDCREGKKEGRGLARSTCQVFRGECPALESLLLQRSYQNRPACPACPDKAKKHYKHILTTWGVSRVFKY